MKITKIRWISGSGEADNTFVLLGEDASNVLPEWRVLGYVMLRQVYDRVPAKWYAFRINLDQSEAYDLGSREKLIDARLLVTESVTAA